ncbi:membrane hypothetical protein [Candidatus Magnetomoraceae bacterium gMMP-15]
MQKNSPKKSKTMDNSQQKQPASPKFYALLSLVSFAFGVGLLLLFVAKAGDPNASQQVFYVLLLVMGASVAAFLFGAMRSYATFKGKTLGGLLEIGGPIVAAAMIVVGGFTLIPQTGSFDVTVFVHSTGGQHEIIQNGNVIIDLKGKRWPEKITEKGAAYFIGISSEFYKKPVPVMIDAKGFELAKPNEKILLKPGGIYLEVKQDDSLAHIAGTVKNTDGDFLKGVSIRIGKLKTFTDEDGYFEIKIPQDQQKERQKIIARLKGYNTWEGMVYPATGQDVGILMNQKER